jgi:hypothetical protein
MASGQPHVPIEGLVFASVRIGVSLTGMAAES